MEWNDWEIPRTTTSTSGSPTWNSIDTNRRSLSNIFSRYLPAGGNGPARNLSDDSSSHNKVETWEFDGPQDGGEKKNQKKSDGFE